MLRVVSLVGSLAFAAGCADTRLEHGGSTVPVPDMTKITFSQEPLSGRVIVSGTSGAVQPLAEVVVTNLSKDTVDTARASDAGAFAVILANASLGDTLTLRVDHDGEQSDTVDLDLVHHGEPPAAPIEVSARQHPELEGIATVTGTFVGEGPELVVRIINHNLDRVAETTTFVEGPGRQFMHSIEGLVGQWVYVYGIDPAVPGAPGPFVETEIQPL